MKISCEVALDYQGNPKIKITKDKPQITLDVLTQRCKLFDEFNRERVNFDTERR